MRTALAVSLAAALLCGAAGAHETPKGDRNAPVAQTVTVPAVPNVAKTDREAKARAYFTDTVLTTQDGRKVRFYSDVLKDHVVLLSMAYTNCEDACPLIMYNLSLAKRALGERFGKDVRFVTISTDPVRDTPTALTAFAKKHDAAHPEWIFLTGPKASVQLVLTKLGVWTDDYREHFTGMIGGNVRTDHWRKIRPDAPPNAVAAQMLLLADESTPPHAAP